MSKENNSTQKQHYKSRTMLVIKRQQVKWVIKCHKKEQPNRGKCQSCQLIQSNKQNNCYSVLIAALAI